MIQIIKSVRAFSLLRNLR